MKEVKLYTKNSCGFCVAAKNLLTQKNIPFEEINLEDDPDGADHLFEKTGFRTVPQIFLGDECIGGFRELLALDQSGELTKKIS